MTSKRIAHQAESAFLQPADSFSLLFHNHPIPMWIRDVESLAFLEVNDAAVQKYGYTRDEFLGMTINEIRPQEDVERLQAYAKEQRPALQLAGPWRHRLKNGCIIDVEITSHIIEFRGRTGALVMAQDVTERTQAEEALRESEHRFRGFIENASDIVYELTQGGIFAYVSPNWADLMGEPAAEAVGKPFEPYLHPDDVHACREFLERVPDTGEPRVSPDYRVFHRDGSIRWHSSKGSALRDGAGKVVGYLAIARDITERKAAEQELIQSRDLLTNLARLVPSVIYQYRLYHDGRSAFPFSSPGMNDIYEVTPEEVREDASPVFGRLHPDDYDRIVDSIQESARTLQTFHCEFRVILPRQGLRWRWSQAHPERMDDGGTLWHGIISDITERKQAEEALRRQAERLRNLHRTDRAILLAGESPEAIIQTGLQHLRDMLQSQRVSVGIFDAVKKVVRVIAAEVDGETIVEAGEELAEGALGSLEILQQDGMEVVEDSSKVTSPSAVAQLLQAEGMRSWINVPLVTAQGLIGALNVGWEDAKAITSEETEIAGEVADQMAIAVEQDRLLQETKRHSAELERRLAERAAHLEAANHELEAFAYSVSHDLRAPLRAMEGFSTALLSRYHDQLDERGRHYLDRIQQASQRMGDLIDDLLNLSRITRSELNSRRVDLSDLARAVAADLKARDPQRQVEFVIAQPLIVQGDARLLRIALQNLLDNAWKFSSTRQKATIEVGRMTLADLASQGEDMATHLIPSELSNPRTAVYYVRDNGVGFDMAFVDKLFAPFQRLHAMDEFPGTGIGLATVQRVIARHGGRVWPNARVERGATFYFTVGGAHDSQDHPAGGRQSRR